MYYLPFYSPKLQSPTHFTLSPTPQGWLLDSQPVSTNGSPYLMTYLKAHGLVPCEALGEALAEIWQARQQNLMLPEQVQAHFNDLYNGLYFPQGQARQPHLQKLNIESVSNTI